jgi:hypothetical protein
MHSMTFEDPQFIYDNMSEPEYSDEQAYEHDYEPDLEEPEEDFNAECRW